MAGIKGIDVSEHQKKIDWEKVKSDGVQFAMLRMGVGSDIQSQTDDYVLRNAEECDRLGIPYGLYIYSYATSESKAHSEAKHMIRVAKQVNATLGYYYDMEDADGYKLKHNFNPRTHKAELTNFCLIFLEDMKKAGYDNVGVYANKDYFTNILDIEKIRKIGKIWLAQWGVSKPYVLCNMWQYTSKGKVNGISGNVDMNIYYGDTIKVIEYYPKPNFTLLQSLEEVGAPIDFASRVKIASANGITNYKGTSEQNLKMLDLLNNGKLIKP